jgi:hypothetical protein
MAYNQVTEESNNLEYYRVACKREIDNFERLRNRLAVGRNESMNEPRPWRTTMSLEEALFQFANFVDRAN